ncbi:uncharacterized protein LOC115691628 isoform X2 [Syzygium oleosum]|uniref:uncharacterized protein LOC115691628 isoform X2 n=1 Tax=Syzygium oleosum TaxID=219896 RepID=UPI0024B8D6CD|nr:uncharacterized protein LOC115691628 isoform X2 [Syzygium oleosum]
MASTPVDPRVSSQVLPLAPKSEEDCNDMNGATLETSELPIVQEKIICPYDDALSCREECNEHLKPVNNEYPVGVRASSDEDGVPVKVIPDSQVSDLETPGIADSAASLNTGLTSQDAPSEDTKYEVSGQSTSAASVGDSGAQPLNNAPKGQIIGVPAEDDSTESKERFRQRLWCFLFENLNRAVDELYLLCELECDLEQMKEAILVLEEAASDFKELASRVEKFENVKKSALSSPDLLPINLKTDHRRPHALSWEVRRMTTSPHRAEILSSSVEAFRKIQHERASLHLADSANSLASECLKCQHMLDRLSKSDGKSDMSVGIKDMAPKSRKHNGRSDLVCGSSTVEMQKVQSGRPGKVNFGQSGHVPSQNLHSPGDFDISKPHSKNGSASFSTRKSSREQGSEPEKLIARKDKVPSEGMVHRQPKYVDHLKRHGPLCGNDKEKRNVNSWKTLDAWKEKRNWEEILSSPIRVSSRISHSPGLNRKSAERARTLHDKLMSPEKKKKTALDLKREAEEKHARAMRIRIELENERMQKLQRTSEKLNRVNEWQAVRSLKLREGMYARHQRSESRHEAFLAQVVRRAGDESTKVNEVRFITSLNEENKKLMLRQKLHDSELRRAEKLQVMKIKQREDLAREEAVIERRKLIEAEKLQRLAETQRKKEEAQVRREEERKASSAAREARAMEQLRRKEVRAKAQQEEAELLAQKLAERLQESEQRRKFYLEQIRERASMDFRDQSSPLLRRYINKESHGRDGTEDYQANVSPGTATLATGNTVAQHSLKRRIKRIRQRLMALKYEYPEPLLGSENTSIGYRTAVGTARAKIGRWLQELQRLRQARKEGALSIGLIIADMIKFLDGKDPELQASRQAGLIDFIASALPASHTSKPEACQVTVHLLKLLKVVLSVPANRSFFLAQNLLPPIVPMLSAALENYVQIAASLNISGSTGNNVISSKTSVENFEITSEVLDGFLWTVTAIIGHINPDERQLQMREGLLELLIAYQVIHHLRDLFALYDRPQVEGSPFPSSIVLSIHLLVVLTARPGAKNSIDREFFPAETEWGFESAGAKPVDSAGLGNFSVDKSFHNQRQCEEGGSRVIPSLGVPEILPSNKGSEIMKSKEAQSAVRDSEMALIGGDSVVQQDSSSVMIDVAVETEQNLTEYIAEPSIPLEDCKLSVNNCDRRKDETTSSSKQPVALLLSAISETGLVSLPSLLTSVLLQANNRLSSEQARLDLKMEFFHLMSFFLSHCNSKWKSPKDQVGLLLIESLLLLGHFALFHTENQAVLRWGNSPTILHKVCDLPFVFFSDPDLMPVLAGTLVAACYGCEQNRGVIQQELSIDMLRSLLKSCKNALPSSRSHPVLDNSPYGSCENTQLGHENKKPQADKLRSSRGSGRNSRNSLMKGISAGNNAKLGKKREKAVKVCEETAVKYDLPITGTTSMLHSRFPDSFIDRADKFFAAGFNELGEA